MKKKRINLLENRVDYQNALRLFYYVRVSSFFFFFIFLLVFFFSNLRLINDKKKLDSFFNQKKILLENEQSNIDEKVKINLLNKKYQNIQLFLKDDAQFLPYYNLLLSSLKTATAEPTLLSFTIDKEKNTEFNVGFSNFKQVIDFLNFIEGDYFLNKFESLVLNGFSISEKTMNLSFKGKFIFLKNENL